MLDYAYYDYRGKISDKSFRCDFKFAFLKTNNSVTLVLFVALNFNDKNVINEHF